MERFYEPSEGEVLIDGIPLSRINLRDYRRQVGYVSQEPTLFNTTIRKNLLLGNPTASEQEIDMALRKTNSLEIVERVGGLEANVGSGGGQLSGGQKQRLALARAFIKKPRLLIFDEATSALDKKNEAEV
jgi:ATP-binding cassette, subfamily B (MDR/TAP), member 1